MVNLWHIKAQTTQVFDNAIPQAYGYAIQKIHTAVNPLTVEFDLDQDMTADETTFTATYSYSSQQTMMFGDEVAMSETSTPSSAPSYTGSGFVGARNIDICGESIVDPNAGSVEGSFSLAGSIDIPLMIAVSPSQKPPFPSSTGLGLNAVMAYADYDTSRSHSGVLPPTDLFPWSAVHTIFNDPNKTGTLSGVTNTTTCTITTKSLAMNYIPQNRDVTLMPGGSMKGEKAITINLLHAPNGNYQLHANNLLQPTVGGQDVSSSFKAWRWVRVWNAPLGSDGGSISGKYTTATPAPSTQDIPTTLTGWMYDNGPASEVREKGWVDNPEGPLVGPNPSQWPSTRQLNEFVASVYQYPEFGLLYYIVVFDVLPNACRVTMYPAQSITVDQWQTIKNSSAPYTNETLAASVLSSGWVDSNGKPTQPAG